MSGNLGDELGWLSKRLGLERQLQLAQIQAVLDQWYPGTARAKSLDLGILRVVCSNSSVASELRMRQVELKGLCPEFTRLAISTA